MAEPLLYYNDSNIKAFPSSNSVDEGKLTLEENLTGIPLRITKRNFTLSKTDFALSIDQESPNKIKIAPGEANLVGYHVKTNLSVYLDPPETLNTNLAIGMTTVYDGSDHILGPVISGGTEVFNGIYISWFDKTFADGNDKILILGTANWDGNEYHDLLENPNKTFIIDSKTIIISDGFNLDDLVNSLPDTYVRKIGDYIQHHLIYQEPNKDGYAIWSGYENYTKSQIKIKAYDSPDLPENIASLYATSTLQALTLGNNELSSSNGILSLTGDPFQINSDTEVLGHTFKVTSTRMKMYVLNDSIKISDYSDKRKISIKNGNDDTYLDMLFTNQQENKGLSLRYYDANNILMMVGSGTNPRFTSDVIMNFNKTVYPTDFQWSNGSVINSSVIKLVSASTVTNTIDASGISSTSSTLGAVTVGAIGGDNDYSKIFNNGTQILSSSSGASSITFKAGTNDVQLYKGQNSNVLNLRGSFTASGDIRASRVYNAVYNDYAEWFKKKNPNEEFEVGDVVELAYNDMYQICNVPYSRNVVGVVTDSYGIILGGPKGMPSCGDGKHIPIGVSGRVVVNVFGEVKEGDLLVSAGNGKAKACNPFERFIPGTIIGKAITSSNNGKARMIIMLG